MSSRAVITPHNAASVSEIAMTQVGFITDAAWSPDGSILAVSGGEQVSLWVNGFGDRPDRHMQHGAPVKAIAFTPDGSALFTASSDTLVRMWSTVEDFILITMRGHTDSVDAIAVSVSGRLLASGGADGSIRVIDMTSSIGSTVLSGHTGNVSGLVFNDDGSRLASGGWDNRVRLWDLESRAETGVLEFADKLRGMAVTPDRSTIAVSCRDGEVRLIDFASGEARGGFTANEGGADGVIFSPDGSLLATGGRDHQIMLWDWRAGKRLAVLTGHSKPVLALAFNPAGTLLLSGGGDNTVRLWSVGGAIGDGSTPS